MKVVYCLNFNKILVLFYFYFILNDEIFFNNLIIIIIIYLILLGLILVCFDFEIWFCFFVILFYSVYVF